MKVLTWQARDKNGVSLRKLSKMTGITYSTLWRIENHEKSPTLDELKLIAMALQMRISDLYDDELK